MVFLSLTLPHIGDGDWMRGDSAWYAAIGVQGWRTGRLWTLFEAPGRPYFNKPPLGLWIEGMWLWLTGVGAWQARVVTVAAGAICVACVSAIARRLGGRHAGLVGGILLAVNVEFFRRTREISLDMWNAAFMLIAAWALVGVVARARDGTSGGAWRVVVGGVAIGAALMTKPIVGLLAPAIIGAWAVVEWWRASRSGDGRTARAAARGLAAVLVATVIGTAIAAPWHVSMVRTHGDLFVSQYFGREIVDRAAGGLVGGQRQTQPAWFYLANVGSAWSVWIVAGLLIVGLGGKLSRGWNVRVLWRFGLAWAVLWLVAISAFADRRDRYAIAVHAGLALVGAAVLGGRSRRVSRVMAWVPAAAGGGALVFALIPVSVQRGVNPQWPELFAWLKSGAVTEVWDGSFSGAPGARVYLEMGAWPRQTRDGRGEVVAEPGEGAVVLYHRRGGWGPGEGEVVEWSRGDLTATRKGVGPWRPVEVVDPGE